MSFAVPRNRLIGVDSGHWPSVAGPILIGERDERRRT